MNPERPFFSIFFKIACVILYAKIKAYSCILTTVLTQSSPMFHSYRNQFIDFQCKSVDSFLYDWNNYLNGVKVSVSFVSKFWIFLQTNRASRNPNTLVMVIFIAMAVCFVAASFVTFVVNEKTSKVNASTTYKINSNSKLIVKKHYNICPAGNYMFKVNNRNTKPKCEICSELTIKTPERSKRKVFYFCHYL